MSTYRAIAGVSATLRNLLRDRMEDPIAAAVTIAPPDVKVTGISGNRLNLYLFTVTQNGHLANQEIPEMGHPADYGLPPLSLDLHYLLTAFGEPETGSDADLQAQLTLGDAMRVLHDFRIITDALTITRPAVGPVGSPILDPSLLGEFENVKLSLEATPLDELSKIWSAIPEANFRRSVAYEASVVQIESGRQRRRALPVETRRVHVAVLMRPEISAVFRTPAAPTDPAGDPRAGVLDQLTIEGRSFVAPRTWIRLGRLEPIQLEPSSDTLIEIQVPDDTYPADADHPVPRPIPAADRLQPGPQVVQVLARRRSEVVEGGLDRGTVVPAEDSQGSNQLAFTLVPTVSSVSPASGTAADVLTVAGRRLFGPSLQSLVFVGDVGIEVRAPGPGDAWAAPTPTQVEVPLAALADAGMTPGTYPVHVLVNGAQSMEVETFQLT
jgi:hypothetical protein